MVRLAQAASDENYEIYGPLNGDQRQGPLRPDDTQDGEVNIVPWYDYNWTSLFRPISPQVAETLAREAEKTARNVNVGYSQPKCMTFYNAFRDAGWDADKITTPCATHCAALVAAMCNAAGLSVHPQMYTGNERSALLNTGAFVELTGDAYLKTDANLKRGDILLMRTGTNGHTAVVLDDAHELISEPYIVTGNNLRLRKGPGTEYITLAYMKMGDTFNVYSFADDTWAQGEYKGLVGYASMKYLAPEQEPESEGPEEVAMITTGRVNMRKGPGILNGIIRTLQKGTTVFFAEQTQEVSGTTWYLVTYDTYTGWVSGKYLEAL